MTRFFDWLDDRTGYRALVREALYENVPGGARWRYVWGSTLVFAFFTQMLTGFFLWTSYSANAQGAWESVYYIQHEMAGGWLLRGIHHFTAQAMVVLLGLHLMQVVIDGAYKAPREINFWLGLILMLIVLGLSLTGYLLPWDQKGFWATKVATNIMGITPVIGPELQKIVVGGTEYGHQTLTRFFAIHAGLLPALLVLFLVLHIYVFRRHGVTAPSPEWGDDTPFWPDQVLKDAVACLAVLAVVLALVFLPALTGDAPVGPELGAELGAPADPTDQYSAARPEWYFLFLFQLLKYFPGETEVIGAHVIPGLVLLVMFLMPFLGRWKLGHRFNIGFIGVLLLGVVLLTWRARAEDAQNENYIAAKEEAERIAERMPKLVEERHIRVGGAVELVRNDPFLQGPKLFARNCASCHRYDGHDGTGKTLDEKPTASDLGNFGSREWIRAVLTDFSHTFAPLKNNAWYEPGGGDFPDPDPETGEMAMWSHDNREVLLDPANEEDFAALVEALVAESAQGGSSEDRAGPEGSSETGNRPAPSGARQSPSGARRASRETDPDLVKKGWKILEEGTMTKGEISVCSDCHPLGRDATFRHDPTQDNFGYPTLNGYASQAWLHSFLSDPGTGQHYGSKNKMPAFGDQLSDRELDLLVRWLTGDYVK